VARVVEWLSGRGRTDSHGTVVLQFAREVVERRRSMQGALNEVRHPAVLDSLSDDDFRQLDEIIGENATAHPEYAIVLARLAHAASRAKGFDRQIVDAAIRLDSLLPLDDPSRERDLLLRDAYVVAQKAGYARGGRITLARMADRALDADDLERARKLFTQQLEIGDEATDTRTEVDSALACGDILRREGDVLGAQAMFRRASRSGGRINYYHGVAEALVRQIELVDTGTSLETVAETQRQALEAAEQTSDLGLISRILLMHAETLTRIGRFEDVAPVLADSVEIAREIGDLALESRCLQALVDIEEKLNRPMDAAAHLGDWMELEERLGNRTQAGKIAERLGMSLLRINEPEMALDAFSRARSVAAVLRDPQMEQKAYGGLGVAHSQLKQPGDAIDNLMKALEISRRVGDIRQEGTWLATIAQTLMQYGQMDEAIRAINDGLAVTRRLPDETLQGELLTMLGNVYARQGQASRARESFLRALEIVKRIGPPRDEMTLLVNLGQLAAAARQAPLAIQQYEGALQLAAKLGDRAAQARLHGRLGQLMQENRDTISALDHYRHAVDAAEDLDDEALLERSLMALATAQHAVGESAAMSTYRRVLTLIQESHRPDREAMVHYNMGLLIADDGDRATGLKHLYRASDILADAGMMDTDLFDRVEDAIVDSGGQTLARTTARYQNDDDYYDDEVQDERWTDYDRDLPYPPDEVYSESSLPPA